MTIVEEVVEIFYGHDCSNCGKEHSNHLLNRNSKVYISC